MSEGSKVQEAIRLARQYMPDAAARVVVEAFLEVSMTQSQLTDDQRKWANYYAVKPLAEQVHGS